MNKRSVKCLLFDWGDTVMRDIPQFHGPMHLWPRVEAIPGIRETLTQLDGDYTMALATNAADSTESDIRKALARAEMDPLFRKIYCFNAIGVMKPAAGFFNRILDDLALGPADVVMIGDNFEQDILGANRCGIYGVWFNEKTDERRSGGMFRTIHAVSELPQLIPTLWSSEAEFRK